MANIDRVIVFCSPNDIKSTELCVSSIRYWNKTIPLFLHKDESHGNFDTSSIERDFNVELCNSSASSIGNPLSKLFYIIEGADLKPEGERILILDSDVMIFGDLITELEKYSNDLVITGVEGPPKSFTERKYFQIQYFHDYTKCQLEPSLVFNTGHILLNTQIFTKEEFTPHLVQEGQTIRPQEGIKLWDQGVINLVINQRLLNSSIDILNIPNFLWSKGPKDFANQKNNPFLIHWAGTNHPIEERLEHWNEAKKYRQYFLQRAGQSRLLYKIYRIKKITTYYLRQLRLLLLGKRKFMRL